MNAVHKSQEKLEKLQDAMTNLWRQMLVSDKLEELHEVILEMEEETFDFCTEFWRQIMVGIGVLFTVLVIGLLSYFILSRRFAEDRMKTRHLLDLSEAERWSYIETKEEGDLEGQMKILRGRKDDTNADNGSESIKNDFDWKEVKNDMEMIQI